MQDHAGAALRALDGVDLEVTGAAADPAHTLGGGQAGAARFDRDLVGHDEAGIETDTELADELRIGFLVAAEFGDEVLGAALGDGAQVLDRLLLAHADAVVGDGQGAGCLVHAHPHFQGGCVFEQARRIERLETQLVAGVRRIRDQFAQENFLVGVQRMGDEVQQLRHFGLEG